MRSDRLVRSIVRARRARCCSFLLLSAAALPAAGQDPATGKALLEQNCFSCHDTAMYTRPDRKVKDYAGLVKRVRLCELSLELNWFDEEVESVAAYLNDNYYRFER